MLEIIQNSLIINKTIIFLAVSNTESIAADSNSGNFDKEISNEYKKSIWGRSLADPHVISKYFLYKLGTPKLRPYFFKYSST